MERPIFQPVGTPAEDFDTPALIVDLDVMDANIGRFHSEIESLGVRVRPHVSCHQCPHIAHRQAAPGSSHGIAVNTVGEAEVFAGAGFNDILISSQIAGRPKINRLCALARNHRITVVVDDTAHVDALSDAVSAGGASLGILVEIDAGSGGSGVATGADAVSLAQKVSAAEGLRLDGLMASLPDPAVQHLSRDGSTKADRSAGDTKARLQELVETSRLLPRQGDSSTVVSVSANGYDMISGVSGITEIQAGSYALMDQAHRQSQPGFMPAAKILASVISHPVKNSAVLDAGHKSTGPELGLPVVDESVDGSGGAKAIRFSAEHGVLELGESATGDFMPGDKVWLVPYDLELSLNQYDYIRAVRNGKLEGFWPIAARGRFS